MGEFHALRLQIQMMILLGLYSGLNVSLQVELWKPCCHATIGHMYRVRLRIIGTIKQLDGLSGDMACADFGMRGMSLYG